jgi:hypothetical protein
MTETDTEGLTTVEMAPTKITDLEVSGQDELLRITFHDNLESVRGSLILTEETAAHLRDDLTEALEK